MNPNAEQQSAGEAFTEALSLLRAGRIDEGLAILHTLAPRDPNALGHIAYAHYARGENTKALACLKEYVERAPEDANAWRLMARIALESGDFRQAETHARRAVVLRPRDAGLWFDLGEILFQAHNWEAAAHAYKKCLRWAPDHSQAHVRRLYASRMATRERIHAITWRPPVRWLLRWLLSRGFVSRLMEYDMRIALDDSRWRMPLEWGETADWTVVCPPEQTPDNFAGHWEQCQCLFWHWFRSQRLEGSMQKVLEVGIGSGHVAHHFARGGFEILSITSSELARRDRERRGIIALRGEMHFIGERGASFDLILAPYALHGSRAPLFALWEWKRLLRPDGCLFVMAQLPINRAVVSPHSPDARGESTASAHSAFGVPGQVMTLTYWQLRWLFKQTGFHLIAETLEDPTHGCLESVEHVDGCRPADPTRVSDIFVVLRKPGRLPYPVELEKPRPIST